MWILAGCVSSLTIDVDFGEDATGGRLQVVAGDTVLQEAAAVGDSMSWELEPLPAGTTLAKLMLLGEDGAYWAVSDRDLVWDTEGWLIYGRDGWNVAYDDHDGNELVSDTRLVSLPFSIRPVAALDLVGTAEGYGTVLGWVAMDQALGLVLPGAPAAPVSGDWSMSRTDAPVPEIELEGVPGALRLPVAFAGSDGASVVQWPSWTDDGHHDAGAAVAWIPPATTPGRARDAAGLGVGTGWNVVVFDASEDYGNGDPPDDDGWAVDPVIGEGRFAMRGVERAYP